MEKIKPEFTMCARAAAEIRSAILNGSLPPGSRIRQGELAATLGVSSDPIRKALVVLEREGLVKNVLQLGTTVAHIDLPLIHQIYEFRELVEGFVAGKVAQLPDFDTSDLRKIIARARKAARSEDLYEMVDLDFGFHTELYRASGNEVVLDTMQRQWAHIRRALLVLLGSVGNRKQIWDEHEAIVEAISKGAAARAKALAVSHMRGARSWLAASLQGNPAETASGRNLRQAPR